MGNFGKSALSIMLCALPLLYVNCGEFQNSAGFGSLEQASTGSNSTDQNTNNSEINSPEKGPQTTPSSPNPEATPETTPGPETEQPTQESPPSSTSYIPDNTPLKVFPGAQGFGTESPGGRGGEICIVENLNDSGPGSLRHCAQELKNRRIVVFRTGGTILLKKPLIISNPYISIYGQTAPGSGILVRSSPSDAGGTLYIKTHHVLIQHLRFRAGTSNVNASACCRDAASISSSKKGEVHHIILDHNSFSWGADEVLDTWYDVQNITFSHNIISEGLYDNGSNSEGPAGRGFLIGSEGSGNITLHHNLMIHNYTRNPQIKTSGIVDIVNNLTYHWTGRAAIQQTSFGPQKVNWVKNLWIAERNHADGQNSPIVFGDISFSGGANDSKKNMYLKGNIGYHRSSNSMPEWAGVFTGINKKYNPSLGYHNATRFKAPPVNEVEASELEKYFETNGVGATAPVQDSVDTRLMKELKTRTGKVPNCVSRTDRNSEDRCKINAGGWPTMDKGQSITDKDKDGIPDSWEVANGLNPNDPKDSQQDANNDGYTNFEDWIYSLGF